MPSTFLMPRMQISASESGGRASVDVAVSDGSIMWMLGQEAGAQCALRFVHRALTRCRECGEGLNVRVLSFLPAPRGRSQGARSTKPMEEALGYAVYVSRLDRRENPARGCR